MDRNRGIERERERLRELCHGFHRVTLTFPKSDLLSFGCAVCRSHEIYCVLSHPWALDEYLVLRGLILSDLELQNGSKKMPKQIMNGPH